MMTMFGEVFGFDDALIATSTAMTGFTFTASDSTSTEWGKTVSGTVYHYDPQLNKLHQYSAISVTGLKSFLP